MPGSTRTELGEAWHTPVPGVGKDPFSPVSPVAIPCVVIASPCVIVQVAPGPRTDYPPLFTGWLSFAVGS